MKLIKLEKARKFVNNEDYGGIEYQLEDKDIDFSMVCLNGRYPQKGYCVNEKCKELIYVLEGRGKVNQKDKVINFQTLDVILIDKNEEYYLEGKCKIILICTPAWYLEQQKLISCKKSKMNEFCKKEFSEFPKDIFYGKEVKKVYDQFKEIEESIENSSELYKYFNEIVDMLQNDKSYIKLRSVRILCRLSKWDVDNKIHGVINEMLNVLDDDKPTIVRQTLSALIYLLQYMPEMANIVKDKVINIDYSKYKDSMKPLIKKDIEEVLNKINLI